MRRFEEVVGKSHNVMFKSGRGKGQGKKGEGDSKEPASSRTVIFWEYVD